MSKRMTFFTARELGCERSSGRPAKEWGKSNAPAGELVRLGVGLAPTGFLQRAAGLRIGIGEFCAQQYDL
jgi:hypothetical protein